MTSKVEYLGELRTKAEHVLSKSTIITDAPLDNHGKGESFSPTDLVATSLASCMMTIIGIKAQTWNKDPLGMNADVVKIMSQDLPRRIIEIVVNLRIPKEDFTIEEQEILKKAAFSCPVAKSLHTDIKQSIEIRFVA